MDSPERQALLDDAQQPRELWPPFDESGVKETRIAGMEEALL
jgi:hypothetical protein